MARLPVNLYSARAQVQRRAATLLHGMDEKSGSWEELDGRHLADDARGDRTSLLLGGAAGGVALPTSGKQGLLSAVGNGTLFLTNVEKLSLAAQRILHRLMEAGRYTPVGDPYPRPFNCRIIVGSYRPLFELARSLMVRCELADVLGYISLRAEDVVRVLAEKEFFKSHPGGLAALSL
ncbi:MAG TPA: sigma 54-interacting transcriptional regulator [Pyrinomonadaceae bacterium]